MEKGKGKAKGKGRSVREKAEAGARVSNREKYKAKLFTARTELSGGKEVIEDACGETPPPT